MSVGTLIIMVENGVHKAVDWTVDCGASIIDTKWWFFEMNKDVVVFFFFFF